MSILSYPKKLYANVLLLDGEIINWKTGQKNWENGRWISSRQPVNLLIGVVDSRLESYTFCVEVNNTVENNIFFASTSKEFYKMFEISEYCRNHLITPY